jgi:DNA-binding MarR family transcriptional regulator
MGTRGSTSKTSAAGEAWALLARLVYSGPPPFVAIAREFDLRPPSFGMLRGLDEPRTMSEMAAVLHCDNSNVTGLVDAMEERGLVERRPDPADRRVKLLVLTERGRRVRTRMMDAAAEPPEWLQALSGDDKRALIEVLGRAVELRESAETV